MAQNVRLQTAIFPLKFSSQYPFLTKYKKSMKNREKKKKLNIEKIKKIKQPCIQIHKTVKKEKRDEVNTSSLV